jgi:hypothetical protein
MEKTALTANPPIPELPVIWQQENQAMTFQLIRLTSITSVSTSKNMQGILSNPKINGFAT